MSTVRKVISGGQTGADRGGLEGAKKVGLLTGGHAPKGYRTEAGPDPSLKDFGVVELSSSGYPARTNMNIIKSDATVAFAVLSNTPGEILTRNLTYKYKHPYICINPFDRTALSQFQQWLVEVKPIILNIAGNAESKAPGIQNRVTDIVCKALSRGE